MVCHLSALSDPLDDDARQLNIHTSFAGKSKGHLGGGPIVYRSPNEHGDPVPAKLTQTAKETGAIGSRAAYIHDMGTVVRCPSCDQVLIRIVHAKGRYWLDMSGIQVLQIAEA